MSTLTVKIGQICAAVGVILIGASQVIAAGDLREIILAAGSLSTAIGVYIANHQLIKNGVK